MLKKSDHHKIQEVSRKYHVKKVLLFGSSLETDEGSKDIDLAIEGLAPKDFYSYYGELLFILSKPVDIIDLSVQSKFTDLIRKEGRPLYG